MRPYYTMNYVASNRLETSHYRTREAALQGAYDRLDMEQRDALALVDQSLADAVGAERLHMASSWRKVARGKGGSIIYSHGRLHIRRVTFTQ